MNVLKMEDKGHLFTYFSLLTKRNNAPPLPQAVSCRFHSLKIRRTVESSRAVENSCGQ
jgi:hypothetical protein